MHRLFFEMIPSPAFKLLFAKIMSENRRTPPPIRPVQNLQLPDIQRVTLRNGIPVLVVALGTQPLVKVDVIFGSGRFEEKKRLVSRAVSRLLRDGTRSRSGAQIAEDLDTWGASVSVPSSLDTASFQLFALKKYFAESLEIFAEILTEPSFPEKELDTFVKASVAELSIELTKGETVAYRVLTEKMYGSGHAYGWNSTAETYESLRVEDLKEHFDEFYVAQNCQIVVSGMVDDQVLALLDQKIGSIPSGKTPAAPDFSKNFEEKKPARLEIALPNSMQAAIKIGCRVVSKTHPDFKGLFVLNTVLGGYFGSRLMANIREKRGLTYNIYSTVDALQHDSYFYIGTEANAEKVAEVEAQIFKELEKLRRRLVPESELEMVKNYLLGVLLMSLDGPMNVSEVVRSMAIDGVPFSDFENLVSEIRSITPERLQFLAKKYLTKKSMWTVVVR